MVLRYAQNHKYFNDFFSYFVLLINGVLQKRLMLI